MARGFLGGAVVGGVVSVAGAGVLSVLSPLPQAPVAGVQVAAPGAVPDVVPGAPDVVPGGPGAAADPDLVRGIAAPPAASPDPDDASAAAAAGADTPLQPQTDQSSAALASPAGTDASGAVSVDPGQPVLPSPQANLGAAPDTEGQLSISTEPVQPPAPDVPSAESFDSAPSTAEAPAVPGPDAPAPGSAAAPTGPDLAADDSAPVAPATPAPPVQSAETATDAAPDAATEPEPPLRRSALPVIDPDAEEAAPEGTDLAAAAPANRPTIGRPGTTLVPAAPQTDPEADTDTGAATAPESAGNAQPQGGPPIEAFAAPFDNPEGKPLMSIVLVDQGDAVTSGPIGLAALDSFPYPLTFAVDVQSDNAAARAAAYRAKGFEVMALLDLPEGATASDAEIGLEAALSQVPEAVALMEGLGTGLQTSRPASDQMIEALRTSGHGLVLQSKGLNTVQKLALRDGVPAGLIFRDVDSAGQTPTVIRRFLDQAAFRAGQEGGVIMVGRLQPDTISALLLWGLQDRAERVALAPVSAVLRSAFDAGAQ